VTAPFGDGLRGAAAAAAVTGGDANVMATPTATDAVAKRAKRLLSKVFTYYQPFTPKGAGAR
jgi:hypothetical protein